MELVVRLHRYVKEQKADKKIVYVPDPVSWTEAPESMKFLRRQRSRWHRGLFESLWIHRRLLFNPKYGSIGLVSMPYFLIIEFLGPLVELTGYIVMILSLFLGRVYLEFAILLFLLSIIYGSILSMAAVLLEEWSIRKYPKVSDIVRLFFYSLTETLWYRPLTVLWRCEGIPRCSPKEKRMGRNDKKRSFKMRKLKVSGLILFIIGLSWSFPLHSGCGS